MNIQAMNIQHSSFFQNFSDEEIFTRWNSSNTLLELAQKLGFQGTELSRHDYEYIECRKTREIWRTFILSTGRTKEWERSQMITKLSKEELEKVFEFEGIQTLSHLALHFLLSPKGGRNKIRKQILELKLPVPFKFQKGVHGHRETPVVWPTRFYEKRISKKPMICTKCDFKATVSHQIELHHAGDFDHGPKLQRKKSYYTHSEIIPLCANCHTLEHRSGEHLKEICGSWDRTRCPGNLKYKNPFDIFQENCPESYRLQKTYFLKAILNGPEDYYCQKCGVSSWEGKILSLELHHKDSNQKNSMLSNLELLCPNCHRAVS